MKNAYVRVIALLVSAFALLLINPRTVASQTTKITGDGETVGTALASESLTLVRTFDSNGTTFHIRNVGVVPVTFNLSPRCAEKSPSCHAVQGLMVNPVSTQTDGSKDATISVNGVGVIGISWAARLSDDTTSAHYASRSVTVEGHGETDSFVAAGSSLVKFFMQRDSHSTGIYIRNVGVHPVHVQLVPSCAYAESCPPLLDAVVPAVRESHDGRNDYIYLADTLDPLTFDWKISATP